MKKETKAVVTNNIYKMRFIETFFDEIDIADNIKVKQVMFPGGLLDMEKILMNFARYIAQIGVRAFY